MIFRATNWQVIYHVIITVIKHTMCSINNLIPFSYIIFRQNKMNVNSE